MIICAIESSCDDTSIAFVKNGNKILSNITSSQIEKHADFFGVVPEIASREHLTTIDKVYSIALKEANISESAIDAIAVTSYPGLIGSLIIGVNFAKGLSFKINKPLISVNHLLGHIYSAFFDNDISFPLISLLISGGHTTIIKMNSLFDYQIIGKTLDDSCGEAFDKIAKFFELGYPGGPIIDKLAKYGNPKAYEFPLPLRNMKKYNLNFSFSGFKTAVMYHRKKYQNESFTNIDFNSEDSKFLQNMINHNKYLIKNKKLDEDENIFDIAASFQNQVAKILTLKVKESFNRNDIKNFIIAGGSSANTEIRSQLNNLAKQLNLNLYMPNLKLCMDNAAMIGGIAYHYALNNKFSKLDLAPYSRIKKLKRGSGI